MNAADLALYAVIGSSAAQAYSAYSQGRQEEKLLREQAKIKAAEGRRAQDVKAREAADVRREGRRMLARQNVLYAKSGFQPGTGTPLDVSDYTQREIERRTSILAEQGRYAYSMGQSEAENLRAVGRSKSTAGLWRAGTALATGAATAAQLKYQWDV